MTDNIALESIQGLWESAKVKTGLNCEADAKIKDIELSVSKAKKFQVVTTFEICSGEHSGVIVKKFDGLATEENISYFKSYAEVLGLALPEDIAKLPEAIAVFKQKFSDIVTIKVVSKGGFTNVYISKVTPLEK